MKELKIYKKNILHEYISYLTVEDFKKAVDGDEYLKVRRMSEDHSPDFVNFIITFIYPDGQAVCDVHTHYIIIPASSDIAQKQVETLPKEIPKSQKAFAQVFPEIISSFKIPESATQLITRNIATGIIKNSYYDSLFSREKTFEERRAFLMKNMGLTSEEFELVYGKGDSDLEKDAFVWKPFDNREDAPYYDRALFGHHYCLFLSGLINENLYFFKDCLKYFEIHFSDARNNIDKLQTLLGEKRYCEIFNKFMNQKGGMLDLLKSADIVAEKFEQRRCIVCKKGGLWQVCEQCKEATYCSKECQKKDWERHSIVCRKCAKCGKVGPFGKCLGCESVHYCSRSCQKKHWKKVHRIECFILRECAAPD